MAKRIKNTHGAGGFVNVPCALDCECITLMEDRLLAILPLGSRFASYPKFPLVECETEPFISLLQSSDHDARRALESAGVQPNVRFYTKDDYAILAMVEQGLGMSIMPELLLKGRNDRLSISTYSAKNHIDVLISKGFQQIGSSFGRMFLHVVDSLKCMWHELGI